MWQACARRGPGVIETAIGRGTLPQGVTNMARPTIEFFFDFASPWCHIAEQRIQRELAGLPVSIVHRPAYLRGFPQFRAETPYSPAKCRYLAKDMLRCARRHDVPLTQRELHPADGTYMLRVHLALAGSDCEVSFRRAAFHATWVAGADVSDVNTVLDIAESVGADRQALSAAVVDPEIKRRLARSTAEAAERGAFGVPSFFIGTELFWGQDRIDFLRQRVEELVCRVESVSDTDEDDGAVAPLAAPPPANGAGAGPTAAL